MLIISIQKIALIIVFFYNQSIFTMMVSNSFNIDRRKKIRNILAKKSTAQKIIKSKKEKFLKEIFSKIKIYNTDIDSSLYRKINNEYGKEQSLTIFKKNVIAYLFNKKKISFEVIINMLYSAKKNQPIDEKIDLIDFFFDNYEKDYTNNIKMYETDFRTFGSAKWKKKFVCEKNEYESVAEYIILKTIIEIAEKNDFNVNDLNLIDFLIKPEIVKFLNKYYLYNPNNLWKEFLKSPEIIQSSFCKKYIKKPHEYLKTFLEKHKINNKEIIVELLIKYNYLNDIPLFTYVKKRLPTEEGFIYKNEYFSTYFCMSPLHVACRINNPTILNLLLQYMKKNPNVLNLAINSLDDEGHHPIYYASRGDIKSINMLIEAGAECHSCPFVAIAWLYETIDTLDQLNCFNKLIKKERDKFVQQQLYLLALMPLSDEYQDYLIENIEKVLNYFLSNGANFNKRNETGELPIDIALRQYKLNIATQENLKISYKNNYTIDIDYEQLYTLFAFSRKTNVINYGLLYLLLKQLLCQDIINIIMKDCYILTIEKEIYRSYAQKYTPQVANEEFEKNRQTLAKKLHTKINEKINLERKKII